MIFKGSRYEEEKVYQRTFRDSIRQTLTFRRIDRTFDEAAATLLTLSDGDKFFSKAFEYFADEERWFRIADVNPEVEPWDVKALQTLIVPGEEMAE